MSKSEKLEQYNLYEWVNRHEDGTKTRIEKRMEYQRHASLDSQLQEGNVLCESLCDGATKVQWEQLALLLRRDYRNHYKQIVGGVDDASAREEQRIHARRTYTGRIGHQAETADGRTKSEIRRSGPLVVLWRRLREARS